jgi:Tol biopolymer transport system component/tetratricopeptide (TPR) repeat protein
MGVDPNQAKSIFLSAIEGRTPEEWGAYLDEVCRGDVELRQRVEALLAAHQGTDRLLDEPGAALIGSPDVAEPMEAPGTVIGRYKLLEKIGEGGMAVVYMAEQEEPIRRRVALKIIKLGMDTRQVIARFEAERQALALMDHPCIAKVLDAGSTETGRPYFVMELVTGVSITEYCDRNNLSTKDRLNLFLQVCQAVQHAHTKGIIHRDLKPSNVMVTHHDGKPVPKVIDFGIAKATNQKLTEKTLFTRYAHIIGTPAYMSPEQAELSDLDIDTRSDIYSLGVLLYELLTGTTPFSEEELRKAGYIEMQRVIREQEPAKPSTKLSTLGDTLTDIAKRRNCTPDLLRKAIRGDLDWIVMKSLEKDRVRRYETAASFAEDLRRHLEHEPVLAGGPSTTYRLRKFFRRHRTGALAALAATVFTVAAAVVLSLWGRDRQHLAEAEAFRHQGILSQARGQYAKADRQAALETITPILHSRHVGAEARLLYAGLLVEGRLPEEATAILKQLLEERAEIAGAAHALLARILWEGDSPNAEKRREIDEHRRQAEKLLPQTAEAHFLRAMPAVTIKEQLAALHEALELDAGHYESRRLRAFLYYASRQYEKMEHDALAMTALRPGDPLGYSLRATARCQLGRYPEALEDYDRAMARTPRDSPAYLDLVTRRCETLLRMEDYRRLVAEAQACLTSWPDRPVFQYDLFAALTALGDYDAAATLFYQIVRSRPEARSPFEDWCSKYVFDTLAAGRSWHAGDRAPTGPAFLPLMEAEENYRNLSAKAGRLVTDGFTASWSPDGKKLAFSLGVRGYSGVALYDPATKETELLNVPGKDPSWSPDGRYIAFVRDCQVLRVSEFVAAERKNQDRPLTDEEVWVMKADGTEPRRLARGGWPSWSQDSAHVYYQSRIDKMLYSISIVASDAEPKRTMACSNGFPSISPDGRRVAYLEGTSLMVKDLASEVLIAQWPVPPNTWGGPAWSPTGTELCMGTDSADNKMGLWIYQLDRSEAVKTLTGPIVVSSWSRDGKKLIFSLGPPYFELWTANLDPALSAVKTLGPGQTLAEHWQDMLRLYTQRIEADPQDASAYSERARYYDYLGERVEANADMRRWSAVMSGRSPSEVSFDAPRALRRVIKLPYDCELVFSAERPVREIPTMSIAFGQKGRCEMKVSEVPMVVTSILGSCLLWGVDVPAARADFTFGTPVHPDWVTRFFPTTNVFVDCFSSDYLEMFVQSGRSFEQGKFDLWVLKRASPADDWGPPENLGPLVNSASMEQSASLSGDGLELYFHSDRPGGYGNYDLYVTTRATRTSPWGPATNLGPQVNSSSSEWSVSVSSDGLELYFSSYRPGGLSPYYDIYVSKRATTQDPWGDPVNLGPAVNSTVHDQKPRLSPDGLLLLFQSDRPGGYGSADLWMTKRAGRSAPWEPPVNLGPVVNSPEWDCAPCLAPDGSALYFAWDWPTGTNVLWKAPIIPIVDFNGDGKVDGDEVSAMARHLGQNKSLYDIGLTPLGDGIVDANDLIALSAYIGQDVNDPTLIAHWALDETEGTTAADSVGDNNLIVMANATWQPAGGKVGGALAFDGKDDFACSGSVVLDPAKGPFSVIAWVKGGATGRVIVSQQSGVDWLYLNQYGMLTTDLKSSGKDGKSLTSDAYVLDDQWHRVVLTWDGANRALYMDDVEIARDTQANLKASSGNLLIGVGKTMAPTSFWTGLIDDVRIYNRAVNP